MAAAHAIYNAYDAIYRANKVLVALGMTPAKVPASEVEFAERLTSVEVTTCLREPARQLVTLIAKRARPPRGGSGRARRARCQRHLGDVLMPLPRTLSPTNEFRFVCPIFNAETRIIDCFTLEQKLTRGDVQPERKGCQACIRASKCPVRRITNEMIRMGTDPYYSAEPRVGTLQTEVLAHIHPILVRDATINEFGVPTNERMAIEAANDAAGVPMKGKTRTARGDVELAAVSTKVTRKPAPKAQDTDALTAAAMSGDMSAAISMAAKAPEPDRSSATVSVIDPEKNFERTTTKVEVPKPTDAEIEAVADKAVGRLVKAISKPKEAPQAAAPAPAGKPLSLLELARQRAAQKEQAA